MLRDMLFLHCCELSHSMSVAVLVSSNRHTSVNSACALMVVVWKQHKWLDIIGCCGSKRSEEDIRVFHGNQCVKRLGSSA